MVHGVHMYVILKVGKVERELVCGGVSVLSIWRIDKFLYISL